MEYRSITKLGIKTSLLGFGCMRLPLTKDGKIDEPEAERMLDKAYAAGVNYYDTAYPYHGGESEPVVGRIMKKYDRSSFYLATKLPVWMVKSVEDVEKILDEQLTKLQTDYVDFYLMHAMNGERWDEMVKLGVPEELERIQKTGKIKNLGFSFHDNYEAFDKIINARDWDFCQIQINYMDADEQKAMDLYKLAEVKGVPVAVMEPIKGGTLAKLPEDILSIFKKKDDTATASSFALRWVGTLSNVYVILSGMSSMEHVDDNLKSLGAFKPMDEDELKVVDEVKAKILSRTMNGCTGCRYCMPCPMGVDIPASFSCWNKLHMYENYYAVNWTWDTEMGESKQPKNCVECGKCENACPQKIAIREDLKKAQKDLDDAKANAK